MPGFIVVLHTLSISTVCARTFFACDTKYQSINQSTNQSISQSINGDVQMPPEERRPVTEDGEATSTHEPPARVHEEEVRRPLAA